MNKNNKKSFSLKKAWIWVIVPVLSIILNAIVSDIQDRNGILSLIISLVFVALILIIHYFFHSKVVIGLTDSYYYFKLQKGIVDFSKEYSKRLETKSDVYDASTHKVGIVPEHELAKMESSQNFEEIWVISNDLSAEVGQYADIVPNNLKRGIKYKFFYQNTQQNAIRVEQVKRQNNNSPLAEYYCLRDDFFFIVTNLDFTIYDPYTNRIGYMGIELPHSDELYAVKVNSDLTDAIASKLLGYLQNSSTISR